MHLQAFSRKESLHSKRARDTARSAVIDTPVVYTRTPFEGMKNYIAAEIAERWDREWKRGNRSKLHTYRKDTKEKLNFVNFKRKEQSILTRLHIGHTAITHRHLLQKEEPNVCQSCNTITTVQHIMHQCPDYADIQTRTGIATNPETAFSDTRLLQKVLDFIKQANLYNEI